MADQHGRFACLSFRLRMFIIRAQRRTNHGYEKKKGRTDRHTLRIR